MNARPVNLISRLFAGARPSMNRFLCASLVLALLVPIGACRRKPLVKVFAKPSLKKLWVRVQWVKNAPNNIATDKFWGAVVYDNDMLVEGIEAVVDGETIDIVAVPSTDDNCLLIKARLTAELVYNPGTDEALCYKTVEEHEVSDETEIVTIYALFKTNLTSFTDRETGGGGTYEADFTDGDPLSDFSDYAETVSLDDNDMLCDGFRTNFGCLAWCDPEVCDGDVECTYLPEDPAVGLRIESNLPKHFLPLVQGHFKINDAQEATLEVLLKLAGAKDAVLINNVQDAIAAIQADYEEQNQGPIDVVIFGHGKPGHIKVGEDWLEHKTDKGRANQDKFVQAVKGMVNRLYLYGCSVGEGSQGQGFISKLNHDLQAPVHAWTGKVGVVPHKRPDGTDYPWWLQNQFVVQGKKKPSQITTCDGTSEGSNRDKCEVTAEEMVEVLIKAPPANVTISNAARIGHGRASGTYTGGGTLLGLPLWHRGPIGIPHGVVLSTGDIYSVRGGLQKWNTSGSTTTVNFMPGDADLNALKVPGATRDAAGLTFNVQSDKPQYFACEFVFGSEEYKEWVYNSYNDIFGVFVGVPNIAWIPPICGTGGKWLPVSVDNVNKGHKGKPAVGRLCYVNNSNVEKLPNWDPRQTELDGLTARPPFAKPDQRFVLRTSMTRMEPNTKYTVKLVIADNSDPLWDSAAFVKCYFRAGACVIPVDDDCTCVDGFEEPGCLEAMGTFHPDALCDDVVTPCSTGACCLDTGFCDEMSGTECDNAGGTYAGDDTICDPIGACWPSDDVCI